MKKFIIFILCVLLMGCQQTIKIKDNTLRREVDRVMKIESKSLKEITHLDLSFLGIESLEGIEVVENLNSLTLSNNLLTDISPITALNQLTLLDIQNNRVSDLSPLNQLTELEVLLIRNNPIESIEVIENLFGGLRTTDFLVDVTFEDPEFERVIRETLGIEKDLLSYYDLQKLRTLDLSSVDVNNISGIEHALNLEQLIINKPVGNYELIADLKNLKHLEMSHSNLDSIKFLEQLTLLESLNLSYNSITDISVIKPMKNLSVLDISRNKISDVSALIDLTQLTSLYIESNYIADYNVLGTFLDQITETDIFIVYFNDPSLNQAVKDQLNKQSGVITDRDLKSIKRLNASGYDIYDLGGIELLENLIELELDDNRLIELKPLEKLSDLQILKLKNNQITDITSLVYLTELYIVDLSFNQITSIEALTYLSKLDYLYLEGNTIDENTIKDTLIQQLKGTDEW